MVELPLDIFSEGWDIWINPFVLLEDNEVENIIAAVDSHTNISKDYGISSEQVYLIKAHFR